LNSAWDLWIFETFEVWRTRTNMFQEKEKSQHRASLRYYRRLRKFRTQPNVVKIQTSAGNFCPRRMRIRTDAKESKAAISQRMAISEMNAAITRGLLPQTWITLKRNPIYVNSFVRSSFLSKIYRHLTTLLNGSQYTKSHAVGS